MPRKQAHIFEYKLLRRYAVLGTRPNGDTLCLDSCDLGRGEEIALCRYSGKFKSEAGQPKLLKAMVLTVEELQAIGQALAVLASVGG